MPSAGNWPFSSPRKGCPSTSSSTARRRQLEQARPLAGQESKGDALRRALDELGAEGYR